MKLVALSHSKVLNGKPETHAVLKFSGYVFPASEWSMVYLNGFQVIPFKFYEGIVENCDLQIITEYLDCIGYGQWSLLKTCNGIESTC